MIPFQLHRRIPLIRRPFFQRDQLLARCDAIAADREQLTRERDALVAERDRLVDEKNLFWLRHRPRELSGGSSMVTRPSIGISDEALVQRVIAAYRSANTTPLGAPDSFWLQVISDIKLPIHVMLMKDDIQIISQMLRSPANTMLFYGFDTLTEQQANPYDLGWQQWTREWTYDNLLRLAEATGAQRLQYPEAPPHAVLDPEDILRALDASLGFEVTFPNPFADEVGLATSRGVASYRAVQALYQAYRITELIEDRQSARVLEIGGGLGRTAFYAKQFGIENYTIIDLPMTGVAQGYFLGRVIDPSAVSLFREQERPGAIRVLPPSAFLGSNDRYEIVLNVDSMTEMALDTARTYAAAIAKRAEIFLSINHEYNNFTAREILSDLGLKASTRTPYWLRRGYVDEVFRPSPKA